MITGSFGDIDRMPYGAQVAYLYIQATLTHRISKSSLYRTPQAIGELPHPITKVDILRTRFLQEIVGATSFARVVHLLSRNLP